MKINDSEKCAIFGDIRSYYNLGEGNWLFEPYAGVEYTSIRLGIDLEVKHGSLPLAFNLGYATDHRSGYNDRQFQAAVRWEF